jgi:DNA invertase Pin-like site-specific DNA recombinase
MPETAIGIVRVSQVRGRNGDDFASPKDQRERISSECERRGLQLVDTIEEFDVKGATPLERREGMRTAIEAVEEGKVDAIVVAYFDRLVRSLRIQEEILERVEGAGGRVLAVDFGEVSGKTSAQWLSTTLIGAVNQYHGKVLAERVAGAQKEAIARGVAPWAATTPGYTRNEDKVFEPNETAPAVAEAFRMRGDGKPVSEIRRYLAEHGVDRCQAAVSRLFHDRALLGELHFGNLHNLKAHEPIVTLEEFKRAQSVSAPRGRHAKSQLLLARLSVLRCGTCDSRLCAGSSNHGTTPVYRCRNPDCDHQVVISARIADETITEAVRNALRNVEGRASAEAGVRDAERKLERAQADLDAAIRAFTGIEDESVARDKFAELREARDQAEERVEQLGGRGRAAVTVNAAKDWDRLSLDARRDLIRAVVERASVAPGRGSDRVTLQLVSK